jgi:hypothetical protein
MSKYLFAALFTLLSLYCYAVEREIIIGHSFEGRPIRLYKFGSGIQAVIIVAGVHGDERNTSVTAYHIIDMLRTEKIAIPCGKSVFIIPEANPDGLKNNTRTNARNVDLNRNFDTKVWYNTAYLHGKPLYCGEHPFSEPESKCLKNLFESVHLLGFLPIFVTYHSQANSIIDANDMDFNKKFSSFLRNNSKYKQVINYPTYGDAEKWVSERFLIPSASIEFKTKTEPDNEENEKILSVLLNTGFLKEFYDGRAAGLTCYFPNSFLLNETLLELKIGYK